MKLERLRTLRIKHHLTQAHIAKVLHISQRCYSYYETGVRNIPVENTDGIMRLLSRVNGLYCRTDELNFPVCSLLFLSIYAASLLHGSAVRLSLHLPVTISSPFHIIKGEAILWQ